MSNGETVNLLHLQISKGQIHSFPAFIMHCKFSTVWSRSVCWHSDQTHTQTHTLFSSIA